MLKRVLILGLALLTLSLLGSCDQPDSPPTASGTLVKTDIKNPAHLL